MASGWLPGLLTVIAPIAMTYFLLFITGARLLEKTMMQRDGLPRVRRADVVLLPVAAPGQARLTCPDLPL